MRRFATAIVLTALAALAWVSRTIQGQIDAFQSVSAAFAKASLGPPPDPGTIFATPEAPPLQPVPTVHLMPTPTAGSARAWAKLREPIPFQFPGDTTFGEVLKYIRKATRGTGDSGLNVFFEPSESPWAGRYGNSCRSLSADCRSDFSRSPFSLATCRASRANCSQEAGSRWAARTRRSARMRAAS